MCLCICWFCCKYVSFNGIKWTFAAMNVIAIVLVCHYGRKEVFKPYHPDHWPPIKYKLYSEEDKRVHCTGVPKLVWNSSCVPNQRTTPDVPDGCECSDNHMFCDPDVKVCLCKKTEVFHHHTHRMRRNATNHCKVAHLGLCTHTNQCEGNKLRCMHPHRFFLRAPSNLRDRTFCLKERESIGHKLAGNRVEASLATGTLALVFILSANHLLNS